MTNKEQFIAFCKAQLGKPYVLGSTGPNSFDCSGLILAGLTPLTNEEIPRISTNQYSMGAPINPADAQEGDLVFFDTGWINRRPNHNGISIGNGRMVNANSYYNKVSEEGFTAGYWSKTLWGARRIFDENGNLNLSGEEIPGLPDFVDVPSNHPEYEFIMRLREKGIIQGFPGNLFKPEQTVTRAEALKIVLLTFHIPLKEVTQSTFSDIHEGDWYISVVETAKNQGIVNGYPDGTFKPNETINRAEICKIILRTGDVEIPEISESQFEDVLIDSWFCDYVHSADEREMFLRDGNQFFPSDPVTRAEMCHAIVKFEQFQQKFQQKD